MGCVCVTLQLFVQPVDDRYASFWWRHVQTLTGDSSSKAASLRELIAGEKQPILMQAEFNTDSPRGASTQLDWHIYFKQHFTVNANQMKGQRD